MDDKEAMLLASAFVLFSLWYALRKKPSSSAKPRRQRFSGSGSVGPEFLPEVKITPPSYTPTPPSYTPTAPYTPNFTAQPHPVPQIREIEAQLDERYEIRLAQVGQEDFDSIRLIGLDFDHIDIAIEDYLLGFGAPNLTEDEVWNTLWTEPHPSNALLQLRTYVKPYVDGMYKKYGTKVNKFVKGHYTEIS